MKDTILTLACERVVELAMKAGDIMIEEHIEPIAEIGSPEGLIGKKYGEWDELDKWLVAQIYQEEGAQFALKKEYKAVKELEREV